MAEPIIVVKEGSLTVQVRRRPSGGSGSGTKVLEVTVPGNFKFPAGTKPQGKKSGNSWRITWQKPPRGRRRG